MRADCPRDDEEEEYEVGREMRRDARKERRKEEKLTQLTVVAEAAAVRSVCVCVCAGQPSRRTEEGRMWPDKMERDRSVRKKKESWREK